MSMDRIIREEARLIILKALDEQPGGRQNSSILVSVLDMFGITKSREWVHDEMRHLADLGAIVVRDAGTVRIGELTTKGADHIARRIVIEGVARPSLPGV